jgi:hypothetical protein
MQGRCGVLQQARQDEATRFLEGCGSWSCLIGIAHLPSTGEVERLAEYRAYHDRHRPFFLFLAYNGPYGLGHSLQRRARNRHAAFYADKELKSFPRESPHPWSQSNRQYINDLTANVIFYEFENSRMIRTPDWKCTRRFPSGPDELYDLTNDAGERENLTDQPKHAGIQKQLAKRLDAFFSRYAVPKYDLWQGGGSKTFLLTSPQEPLR